MKKQNKISKSIRLTPAVLQTLEELSRKENTTQAYIIEKSIMSYQVANNKSQSDLMNLYRVLSENIETLQIKDETNEKGEHDIYNSFLSDEESTILKWYLSKWEEIRKLPLFTEVIPPELE